MAQAVALAQRGKGGTAPNPSVGALLVRGGRVVAEGWHKVCGGPHAEVNCLADAAAKGVDPADCTLYVTLEPCNHHGKTPPCTQAVLAAGVRRVVVGCADPNPHVAGGGCQTLAQAGVQVRQGVLEQACLDLIADFRLWRFTGRTYNTLKLASTLDGRIAASNGHSAWVSSPESRRAVHELRSRVDAVLVGGGTLRADNPRLTARLEEAGRDEQADDLPGGGKDDTVRADGALHANSATGGPGKQPLAVVVTSRLPAADAPLALLADRPGQTIFWTGASQAASSGAEALRRLGVRVWELPSRGDSLALAEGFARLRSEAGCWATLCEGGGGLALSLLSQGLMDEFVLFLAPKVLGDAKGIAQFSGRTVESMQQAIKLRLTGVGPSGVDLRLIYRPGEEL